MPEIDIGFKIDGKILEDRGRILRATLMDDYYMRRFFSDDVKYIQYVLRIIMGDKGLIVKSVETQRYLKDPKHNVFLDIYAVGSNGEEYDIEIQRGDEDATPKRAFYNLAMLKTNMLEKGRPYSDLRKAVVIFITEHDVIGDNLPLYTAEFRVKETGKLLGVEALIIYVNNEIKDPSTELGQLMHDFSCADADGMYSEVLAEHTRDFKNTKEGYTSMSTVWQETMKEVAKQVEQQVNEATAVRMLKSGKFADEEVADYSALPLTTVQKLAQAIALGTL